MKEINMYYSKLFIRISYLDNIPLHLKLCKLLIKIFLYQKFMPLNTKSHQEIFQQITDIAQQFDRNQENYLSSYPYLLN